MPFPQTGKRLDVGPKAESIPVRQVTVNAGEYLHWSGDSRAVHYALGDEVFTRRLDETFAFVPGAPPELPKVPETRREGRLRGEGRQAEGHGRDRGRARRDDAGRRGHPGRGRRRPREPHRRGRAACLDAGAARRHGDRRGGEDGHPRPRRRALARRDGRGRDRPAAELGGLRVARPRRDDRPRPVERHERDLHARRDAEGRARGRPARLLDGDDPLRRQGVDHREGRQPGRRAHAPQAHARGRRDLREELQPAAPRPAPADPRGGPRDEDARRARGRVALPAQHDDGRGRPHRRRARDPARHPLRRREAAVVADAGRLHADPRRRLRRPRRRALLLRADRRLEAPDPLEVRAAADPRVAVGPPRDGARGGLQRHPRREDGDRAAARGRAGEHRCPRPARGPRRALGDVDARDGRHDAARGAARGDAQPRALPRPRRRHRLARARQARRPRGDRRRPARRHPPVRP